jgi:hypothetical protein
MITLYGSPNTRATGIAWMLEELGQGYLERVSLRPALERAQSREAEAATTP